MNNKQFIQELSKRTGYKNADTQKMMLTVLNAMGDAFIEGRMAQIPNFGTFEVKKKMERIIVNPNTGQRMLVPPKLVLGFKPNDELKEKIKRGADDNG